MKMAAKVNSAPVQANDDVLTVCAISLLTEIVANVVHEGLGHAATALLSGAKSGVLTTVAWSSEFDSRLVAAGGTLANLGAAMIFWIALRSASPVRGSRLLHGAAVGIEWPRTLQMRRGILQPHKTVVVQVREDGRDGPATAFLTRRLGAPRTSVEMREHELVHCVVARVGFEQAVADLGKRRVGLECHRSSANLPICCSWLQQPVLYEKSSQSRSNRKSV
jgi:hypothetical protein